MPQLSVYSMGEKGVNTTKSPIHLEDGELTRAQNWQPDLAGSQGSIRSRDGLTQLNASALAGTVTGSIGVPLPDRSALTRTFYAAMDDLSTGTDAFRTSTNGTTWSTLVAGTITRPASRNRLGTFGVTPEHASQLRWATLNNKMYYPGNGYTDGSATSFPTIQVWDGTTDYTLCQIPHHVNFAPASDESGVLAIVPYSSTELLVSTYDGNGAAGRGRVFLLDVTTGQLTQLGPETSLTGAPQSLVVYQGKIWAALSVSNGSQGSVLSVRNGEATWTTEFTPAVGRGAASLAVFGGNLYCGQSAAWAGAGNSAIISRRVASTTTWSTVLTADGTGTGNILSPVFVTQNGLTLLVFWNSVSGGAAPATRISSSTDGTTWATDFDIATNVGATYVRSGYPFIDTNGTIYWTVLDDSNNSVIMTRTSAGTWSTIVEADPLLRGPMTSISF